MPIYFDTETLPCADAEFLTDLKADLTKAAEDEIQSVKAPSNYKDEAKIAEFVATKRAEIAAGIDAAFAAKVAKTSFDGMYGRIACIAWGIDDGAVDATSPDDSEAIVLHRFFGAVEEAARMDYHGGRTSQPVTFCGHNIAGFDLPFLKHRAIIHGIRPPAVLLKAMTAKPWDSCIADTMLMWSSDPHKRGSMDRLCKALGIKGKDGFDGSMVAAMWPIDPLRVIDYCMDDVEKTRAIYKRITFESAA